MLTNRAAIAATIAISTRLIAFMFSLALSTVIREVHRVPVRAWPTSTPHTQQQSHVGQMRDLTHFSYASLIVDRRNITGRHPPGNAEASESPRVVASGESLPVELLRVRSQAGPTPRSPTQSDWPPVVAHMPHRSKHRFTTGCFTRLTRNHSSIMVRRNVVPQPPVVIGVVSGRISVALVNGFLWQRVPENLVNYIPRPLWCIRHSQPSV